MGAAAKERRTLWGTDAHFVHMLTWVHMDIEAREKAWVPRVPSPPECDPSSDSRSESLPTSWSHDERPTDRCLEDDQIVGITCQCITKETCLSYPCTGVLPRAHVIQGLLPPSSHSTSTERRALQGPAPHSLDLEPFPFQADALTRASIVLFVPFSHPFIQSDFIKYNLYFCH